MRSCSEAHAGMTPEEMVALIEAAPPGPWPEGWRGWPCVCEAHRIMFRREAQRVASLVDPPMEWKQPRGIVTCGGGLKYFPGVWVLAHVLRDLGCTLPIQVWYLGSAEMDPGMARLLEPLGVQCVDAFKVAEKYQARILCGFEVKIYATLFSPFQEVLFLDADNLPNRDPSDLFSWPQYLRTGAVFWPDYACWKLKSDVWHIWGMEDILEDVIDDTAFESGQYLIDKRRCWRELMLSKWLGDHSDYVFGTVYGDKECFHLAWRRLGREYAMPRYAPGWAGRCCIVQHDFEGNPIFFHRCQDKWRLDGRNRLEGLPHEDRAFALLKELRQKWSGVPWRNHHPTPQEQEIIAQLQGKRYIYQRVGHDQRVLVLEKDQWITEGSADCERRWDVHIVDGEPVLTISAYDGPTCHLRRDEVGIWRGRWLHHERMPIVLAPTDLFGTLAWLPPPDPGAEMTDEERAVFQSVAGRRLLYERVGYDQRPIKLEPDGTISEGAGGMERTWHVRIVDGAPVLTITDGLRPTCHLRRGDDGRWRGQWLRHERMPILLSPMADDGQGASSPREGESAASPPSGDGSESGDQEDEDPDADARGDLAALVTVAVVSFRRFACLAELLRSIRAHYPDLRVIVADQSGPDARTDEQAQWCRRHPQVQWLELPFDCGLSAARNAAIAQVRTPYVWLMDDDFQILPCTDAMAALHLLQEVSGAELVAGPLYDLAAGRMTDWAAMLTIEPGPPPVVRSSAPGLWRRSKRGTLWRPVGRFLNSFIARTQTLRRVPWREQLKIRGEHRVHLADLVRHGVSCIETPSLTLAHQAQRRGDATYQQMRSRRDWHETPLYRFAGNWWASEQPAPTPAVTHPCRGVVVLTPGHTGSRVVARLLDALGWRIPELDAVFGEPADVRAVNQRLLRGERLPPQELRAQVAAWPRPWCIKDPRLCETLDAWLPALADDAPLLVVVERDMDATCESWRSRGEPLELFQRRLERIGYHWAYWPWERRRVAFEAICAAWQRIPEPGREGEAMSSGQS